MIEPQKHSHISNDPLHGITLKHIMESLVDVYDWEELGGNDSDSVFSAESDDGIES